MRSCPHHPTHTVVANCPGLWQGKNRVPLFERSSLCSAAQLVPMLHCNTKVVPLGAWSWVLSGQTLQVAGCRGAGGGEGGQVHSRFLASHACTH